MQKDSNFFTSLPTLVIFCCCCVVGVLFYFILFYFILFYFIVAILMGVRGYLMVVLICTSWMITDVKYLLMCCWPFVYRLWRNVSFKSFVHFLIGLFVFLLLSYSSSLHILDINPLSDMGYTNTFSHSVGCLFSLLCPWMHRNFKFWYSPMYLFLLLLPVLLVSHPRSYCQIQCHEAYLLRVV